MKTTRVDNHDYITVSVKDASVRLNFTVSFGGQKVSGSVKPGTAGESAFNSAFNVRGSAENKTINSFLRGKGSNVTPLKWISAVKTAGDAAVDVTDFFKLLDAKLAEVNSAA